MLESLESRQFLSVSFDPASGELTIVGTPNVDSVIFSEEILHGSGDHKLRLHFNGETTDYDQGAVKSLRISTLAGADLVILGTISVPSRIDGGPGNDALSGGDARDVINGDGGDDYCFGRKANDQISGGVGYDLLMGGRGSDTIVPFSDDQGDDTISGGAGGDTVDYTDWSEQLFAYVGGVVPDVQESDHLLADIEVLVGSRFGDQIENSTRHAIYILGGPGNDTITGGGGLDTIDGGAGLDSLRGVGGVDVFIADDNEADTIDGGSGDDAARSIDLGVDSVINVSLL